MRRAPNLLVPVGVVMLVVGWLIPPTAYSELQIALLFGLWGFAYVFVGGLIAARRPENAVGWLTLGIGALMSMAILLGQYAGYALLRDSRDFAVRIAPFVPVLCHNDMLAANVLDDLDESALGQVVVSPTGHRAARR